MKKFELHMDALIVVAVVFALAVSFLLYQRHQYSILMQENVDLQWENSSLEANLVIKSNQFDQCKSILESLQNSETGLIDVPKLNDGSE